VSSAAEARIEIRLRIERKVIRLLIWFFNVAANLHDVPRDYEENDRYRAPTLLEEREFISRLFPGGNPMKRLMSIFATPTAFAATLAIGSLALATTFTVQDVNLKVLELVKPFNDASTKMNFAFTTLNVDAVRTLDFGFTGLVSKIGTQNEATLEFKNAQYAYGDGSKPTVDLDVALTLDLVKALGQDVINKYAGEIDGALVEMSKDFVKDYGSAITVSAKTEETRLDAQGNVEFMKLHLNAVMDFTQLPASKPLRDVEFQNLDIVISAGKTGMSITAEIVANPLFKGFDPSQDGMKEYVEKLLVDDQQTYNDLGRYLAIFDSAAAWLVDLKP
jgi:hypothetical protein